jgi:hypothetical protein
MAHAGEGYKFHVTGLTHDERGYPNMTPQTQDKLVRRLQNKIRERRRSHLPVRRRPSFGRCRRGRGLLRNHLASGAARHRNGARARTESRQIAPDHGVALPRQKDPELAAQVKAFVVPELNLGQMVREVERAAAGKAKTIARPARRRQRAQSRRNSAAQLWRQADERASTMNPVNPVEPFLRSDRMPHIWCPGCGIGTTVNCFARALIESKIDLNRWRWSPASAAPAASPDT